MIVEKQGGEAKAAYGDGLILCDELSWSHYRLLISVENEEARAYFPPNKNL